MSAYKRYSAYKDSGVPWLGKVPEHWGLSRFGHFLKYLGRGAETQSVVSDCGVSYVTSENLRFEAGVVSGEKKISNPERVFPSASIVVALIASVGKVGISKSDFCTNPQVAVFDSAIDPMISSRIIEVSYHGIASSANTSGVIPYINTTSFLKIKSPKIPLEEQAAIAAYLDRETSRIDTLIAAQCRLIGLLKEKRSALISHAVTKGLNPDAPMKDSGVPWLGRVPEGWGVDPLKRLAKTQLSNVNKLAVEGERPVKLCNYVDVYKNERITANMEFMLATASDEQIRRLSIRRGDVLITKDSETPDDIGVPSLVSEDCEGVVCGYHLALLRPHDGIGVGGYLARLLTSASVRAQFSILAVGMTRYGLGKYDIENAMLPVPPAAEQAAIAVYLDYETTRIDALIAKTERTIDLAQERRGALISAAVTGKIDVRDAVPGPAPRAHAPG